tara:strand:- start:1543 stop:1785 length:243 start_codon:yes stop_codon:yes gene_type:complete
MAKIETYATATPSTTDMLLGTDVDSTNATKNYVMGSLTVAGAAPASAAAAGTPGQIAADASYFYVCVAANTWKRVAIATW